MAKRVIPFKKPFQILASDADPYPPTMLTSRDIRWFYESIQEAKIREIFEKARDEEPGEK